MGTEDETEIALVENFTGTCHICNRHVDGRVHNATWNPAKGVAHTTCPNPAKS